MMQLYCPACENVVRIEGAEADDVVPCPECEQPICWHGRRKARLALNTSMPRAPARETALAEVEAAPVSEATWEDPGEQDFSIPCPEPATRFVPLPYRSEGGVNPRRLPFFLVAVLLGGMILGLIASALGQVCYLVFLYPLALGLGMAGMTVLASHLAHVRSPQTAGLVAVAGGIVALLAMHALDYHLTMRLLESEPSRLPAEMVTRLRASSGFLDYLDATAGQGLTISGSDTGGLNLGRAGTYLYWLGEFVLVILVAAVGGASAARDPFCSSCRAWKEERFLGTAGDGGETLMRDLKRGNLSAFECCQPSPAGGELALTASVCPRCGPECPIDLRIERNRRARKEPVSVGLPVHLTYPGEALNALENVFANSGNSND